MIAQWGWEKQLTKHWLLPVLIESELTEGRTLIDKIRGVLSAQTNQGDSFPPELVEKLLRRQRLLVILNHLSEMGEKTARRSRRKNRRR
ncbi:MAG: hypothetical protein ACKO5P_04720 [Nodosilinea sp.]